MNFFLFTSKERNTTIFIYFMMSLAYILVFFKPISVSVRVNNFCLILFLYKEALDINIKSLYFNLMRCDQTHKYCEEENMNTAW